MEVPPPLLSFSGECDFERDFEGELERDFEGDFEGELGLGPAVIISICLGIVSLLDASALASDALAECSKFPKKLGPRCLSLLCRTDP